MSPILAISPFAVFGLVSLAFIAAYVVLSLSSELRSPVKLYVVPGFMTFALITACGIGALVNAGPERADDLAACGGAAAFVVWSGVWWLFGRRSTATGTRP